MVVVEASRPRTPDDRMQVDQEEDEETEEDDESASTKMVIDG